MILAVLLLATGLIISAVAIYYSVIGLAAIFAAATIPIYIMGGSLEVAKLVCASWLKANWERAPGFMRAYMTTAVIVLMIITSMGIFGFLSKAHTDQGITSGDVMAKIAIYDEKIKTEKENIDVARKTLKQLDEAVDQVMARSSDERGADKASQIRRAQQRERANLQRDINNSQNNIAKLQSERAPIAAEVRKVEAEVGPIKYIAKLIYGDDPDQNILEKAVTWVIILIVAVFDPLAVIMLLAAQMTFGWIREQRQQPQVANIPDREEFTPDPYVADVGEKPTAEELVEEPQPQEPVINEQTHPYLFKTGGHFKGLTPMVYKPEEVKEEPAKPVDEAVQEALKWAEEQKTVVADADVPVDFPPAEESKKKTKYIIKSQNQQIKKTKE